MITDALSEALRQEAERLDATDSLASYRDAFVLPEGVLAYLDGNSLGRPLARTRDRIGDFVADEWGERLIRSWDEQWFERPLALGDQLGRVVLGAAPGQCVVADSTTVMLYKMLRAAVDAALRDEPGRDEIVADTENFPTDRFVVDAVAAERGLSVHWITPDPAAGVTVEQVSAVVSERTAVVLLSHVAYKSAYVADLPAITAAVHEVGALTLWDLCHSAGAVELALDADGVDLAVGCTYKYLNGGPGAPAFGYVGHRLQERLVQPIAGWMGHADPFAMGGSYEPAQGMRRFISGTPPILGMLPLHDMLDLIEDAGMPALRAKSVLLSEFTIRVAEEMLAPYGVTVASPREVERRGSHVLLEHNAMREVVAGLWERGVIPDFRNPRGLRLGLSPLSTSFSEVLLALAHVGDILGAEVSAERSSGGRG